MSELSLFGHGEALKEVANPERMTDERLKGHIESLDAIRQEALTLKIGRQVEESTRLLMHFTFEQAMREGVSPEEFASFVADDGSLDQALVSLTEVDVEETSAA